MTDQQTLCEQRTIMTFHYRGNADSCQCIPTHIPLAVLSEFLDESSIGYKARAEQVGDVHCLRVELDLKHCDLDSPYCRLLNNSLRELNHLCQVTEMTEAEMIQQ